jgi:hypothetical protein
MYLFVFLWVPVIEQKAGNVSHHYGSSLPLGIIFSAFMCSMMLGSLLYSHIMRYSSGGDPSAANSPTQSRFISTDPPVLLHGKVLGLLALLAAFGFGVSNFSSHLNVVFWAFCIFEASVGLYFPAIGWLRSELVPDEVRATVSSRTLWAHR